MEIITRIDAAKRGLKRYYTGKAMSEDGMVTGGNEGQRSAAEVLYGK